MSTRLLRTLLVLSASALFAAPVVVAQHQPPAQPRLGALMWGDDSSGQCDVPGLPGETKYVQIACGTNHALALRSDGLLVAWGANDHGQLRIHPAPKGLQFVRIAAADHNLALLNDGSLHAWGRNDFGQCDVPLLPRGMTWASMSAGALHSAALRSDGAIFCWGDDSAGQCDIPKPPLGLAYVAVAAGGAHTAALRSDGQVVCWGDNSRGQCESPGLPKQGTFVEIAAGGTHTLARTSTGLVIAWGSKGSSQCVVPVPSFGRYFVDIAAGGDHSLGLLDDGSLLAWGSNASSQCKPPAKLASFEVVRISAGSDFNAVLFQAYPSEILPICLGDGSLAPCPCNNESLPGRMEGCTNSSGRGGRLTGSGETQIFGDTLSLLAENLPVSTAVILQGGVNWQTDRGSGGFGRLLGDGLFCLQAPVTRLCVAQVHGGLFVYPKLGETPLALLGKIAAPTYVQYQVWFRDPRPTCASDGANFTNGLRVHWTL